MSIAQRPTSGIDAVRAAVAAAIPRGLLAAGRIYLADQGARFDRNAAGGGDWPPLAESTAKRKGSRQILVGPDGPRPSLEPGHPENVLEVVPGPSGPALLAGTRNAVAKFHQAGGRHLPRRGAVAPASVDAARAMLMAVTDEVRRAAVAAVRSR